MSRLSKGVDVYLEADAQAPALMLVEPLERDYPDDSVIDLPVYLGHEHVPCRLLAYRLPELVVQERRRKALEEARKKSRELSPEYREWLSFGFYITNVSQQVWPPKVVGTVYRLRWQVGVPREGHMHPVGESSTEVRSSSLVAWEAPWREIKTVKPSDTMLFGSMRNTPGCNLPCGKVRLPSLMRRGRAVFPKSVVAHMRVQDGDARNVFPAPFVAAVNTKDGVCTGLCSFPGFPSPQPSPRRARDP